MPVGRSCCTRRVRAGWDAACFGPGELGVGEAMAAGAHLQTQPFVRVLALIAAGEMAQARTLWRPLQPLIAALFAEPNPGPLKAVLAHMGLIANTLRAPMTPASAAHVPRLVELHAQAGRAG